MSSYNNVWTKNPRSWKYYALTNMYLGGPRPFGIPIWPVQGLQKLLAFGKTFVKDINDVSMPTLGTQEDERYILSYCIDNHLVSISIISDCKDSRLMGLIVLIFQ